MYDFYSLNEQKAHAVSSNIRKFELECQVPEVITLKEIS